MERVKIFTTTINPHELEKKVNDWLASNPNIMIVSQQVTSAAGIGLGGVPFIAFSIVIFYREK